MFRSSGTRSSASGKAERVRLRDAVSIRASANYDDWRLDSKRRRRHITNNTI